MATLQALHRNILYAAMIAPTLMAQALSMNPPRPKGICAEPYRVSREELQAMSAHGGWRQEQP